MRSRIPASPRRTAAPLPLVASARARHSPKDPPPSSRCPRRRIHQTNIPGRQRSREAARGRCVGPRSGVLECSHASCVPTGHSNRSGPRNDTAGADDASVAAAADGQAPSAHAGVLGLQSNRSQNSGVSCDRGRIYGHHRRPLPHVPTENHLQIMHAGLAVRPVPRARLIGWRISEFPPSVGQHTRHR